MFTVRAPRSTETETIAGLILQSDCGMLPALFGANVTPLLCRLQTAPANPYSAEHTLVIVDAERPGDVIGASLGSLAAEMRRTNLRTAGLLWGWYGPALIARLPRLDRAGAALEGQEPDDFYLSHIAVLAAHRGQGAGRELLGATEHHARRQGAGRVVLDVEEHNDGARAFYSRLDYRAASVIRIDLGRRGAFSFLRLTKGL
jgi:ribosomal protein S18 acetylase RimI-like enzyme